MARRFTGSSALVGGQEMIAAIHAGDDESLGVMRPLLEAARPDAGWVEDELDSGGLPAGEWWVTDPLEGAINFVHGIPDWGVTATLVRDNAPVLAVVYLPLQNAMYTAIEGGGAFLDGEPLRVSHKDDLAASFVGTGQASPRETTETFALIGRTLTTMMDAAAVTRSSVPPTLQLIHLAAGRMDVFWQHSAVRSGLLPGALLVREAGGTVTDIHGSPWTLDSDDFLCAAPLVHTQASRVLTAAL